MSPSNGAVAAQRRRPARARAEPSSAMRDAASLALEMRVGGDQEQGGEAHRAVRVRGLQLEHQQHREVAGRDQRAEGALGPLAGEQQAARPPTAAPRRRGSRRPSPRRGTRATTTPPAPPATSASRASANSTQRLSGLDRQAAEHQAGVRCRERSQRRGQPRARGVDRPVHRRAVATLDERLVVLVGDRVGACDGERHEDGPARRQLPRQRPPPEHAQQRVRAGVDELAPDQVDHAESAVQAGLRRQEEDHPHQDEGRQPQPEAPRRSHRHTVE